ncbi:MAG TPA: PAS domain-containing protein [Steroidobacteraceae bacterium]|nr:PAS domain-containing protein [Steroidobacteraceae bacterium]
MSERFPTQLLPAFHSNDPRAHPLDDTWLLTISTILLAIAVPWFLSGVKIDFSAAALGLLALGAIHAGFAGLSRRASLNPVGRARTLTALHALGVITVAFIWQHAGGLQNPVLLVAFALPVIGSIFLSRWQPYLMASLAVVLVTLVASAQAPELRWYAASPGTAVDWLSALIGKAAVRASPPFTSFYAPSAYFVVLLEVFVIMLFACAVAAEYLGTFFDRLQAQVAVSRAEAARSQGLWSALVEGLPLPALLLDADTHEILCVSAAAVAKFFSTGETVVGRDLFQALNFSYPEPIERLINGTGGAERLSMVRLRDALLATEVRVQHVAHNGRRLALLMIEDNSEAFCVRSALDVADYAALVTDSNGRVLALNRAARAILPGAEIGADVSRLVPPAEAESRWWDPGLSGRRKMHVTVARRTYQVTSSAVAMPGEDARLYVIAFLPATLAASDQSATGLTALVRRS